MPNWKTYSPVGARARFLLALLLLAGCGQECNSFGRGFGMGPSFNRRVRPSSPLSIGETFFIFNASGNEFPTGGNYVAFPGLERATNGDLVGGYYRGLTENNEESRNALVRSVNDGRTWGQRLDEEAIESSTTISLRGPGLTKLASGRLAVTTTKREITPTQSRVVYYRYSDDDGATWPGNETTVADIGTNFTAAAQNRVLVLANGDLLTPVFYNDTGEGRYTVVMMTSTDDGATWSQLSVIAQDANTVSGRQFEEAQCIVLDDDRILCLIRVDSTDEIFQTYSSDDGATWSELTLAFEGHGKPELIQVTNGMILAATRARTTDLGVLWYSQDRGATWVGPTDWQPAVSGAGSYKYASMLEVAPNIVGILHGQETSPNSRSRLAYTEVGVGVSAPTHFRSSQAVHFGTTPPLILDYGATQHLAAATEFTLEFYIRRDLDQGGVQHILLRGESDTTDLHYAARINGSDLLQLQIASSATAFATITLSTPTTVVDVWYHVVFVYNAGAGSTNETRARGWVNGVEQSAAYVGTFPAAMRTPAAATLYVGSNIAETLPLRDSTLAFLRVWPTAAASSFVEGTMYNNRAPQSTPTIEATLGAPIYDLRFNDSLDDEVGLLSSPAVTGAVALSGLWVP